MTAQIAILNKHGIALATDSAVTITGNEKNKVYNSANKLFSLSDNSPVGIMIYGTAQFLGVPWETIIKLYREKNKNEEPFETLEEYCVNFFEYIIEDEVLNSNYTFLISLLRKLDTNLSIFLNQVNKVLENYDERTEQIVADTIEVEAEKLLNDVISKMEYCEGFDEDVLEEILTQNDSYLDEIVDNNVFVAITPEGREKLKKIMVSLLVKDFYAESTGVVIAGFGKNEIFPSLFEFSLDGIFNGILKFKLIDRVKIAAENSEDASTASINGFAQTEMVNTFMGGIDPSLQDEIFSSFYSVIMGLYPKILTENLNLSLTSNEEQDLGIISNQIFNSIRDQVNEYKFKNYAHPILDTVQLMPKEEMAVVAETLLNLASLKKRVTMDTESVGGPIDVAIISKNDGLIWIKRKHYFKAELNQKYFNK